jgi:hypothetical protein
MEAKEIFDRYVLQGASGRRDTHQQSAIAM